MIHKLVCKAIRTNTLNDGTIVHEVVTKRENEPFIVAEYSTKKEARRKYNSLKIK
jgi:hypothetical protein